MCLPCIKLTGADLLLLRVLLEISESLLVLSSNLPSRTVLTCGENVSVQWHTAPAMGLLGESFLQYQRLMQGKHLHSSGFLTLPFNVPVLVFGLTR